MFRYLVLGLLRDGELRHGYALMKEYRQRSGIRVSTGNFYRELQRLVAGGLVRTASNPANADPRRAPYEITDLGAAAFDRWLTGPTGTGVGRYGDEISSRALFIVDADPSVAGTVLEAWKEELWIRSKLYERERAAVLSCPTHVRGASFPISSILLARSLKHIAADIEFLGELGAAYEEWSAARGDAHGHSRGAPAPLEVARRAPSPRRKAGRP